MSQQPPPQAPYGQSQWGQQGPFPYNRAPNGNTPQPVQGQYPPGQVQWGQQVQPSSFYGGAQLGNPPPQQPFPGMMPYPGGFQPPPASPHMDPQRNQRDLPPQYKRHGRGKKIVLVCGVLVAVVLLGFGLAIAWQSFYGSKPSAKPTPTLNRAVVTATTTSPLNPASTPAHKVKPTTTVVMVNRADYSPATLTIGVGSTVIWKNTSPIAHTVTSDDGTLDSGNLPAGGTFRFTFKTAGTYEYRCDYHPWMTGAITVQ